jgi:pimeloyl-ACP methyl ester carboxylesterase
MREEVADATQMWFPVDARLEQGYTVPAPGADDALTDARFWRRPLDPIGCRVHRGFARAQDGVWDDIAAVLLEVGGTRGLPAVHLMGHSLGGALALLAAHRLARNPGLGTLASVVTMGCPRVGNAQLAASITRGAPVHWVVHASDVVPRVPPLLLGYRHAGSEQWLLADGGELTMADGVRPTLARRLRWMQEAYGQSYAFRQYVLVSLLAALLATAATYKLLGIELSVAQALAMAVTYRVLLGFLVADLVPMLPARLQRWLCPRQFLKALLAGRRSWIEHQQLVVPDRDAGEGTSAVGRRDRLDHHSGMVGHLHQRAAVGRNRPHLIPAAAVGVEQQARAVGRPQRPAIARGVVGHLARARAISVHHPEIFLAVLLHAVERNPPPIGRHRWCR